MLGLSLRDEFKSARFTGTIVNLTDESKRGAIQVSAPQFLEITYPTLDVLKALEAVGEGQSRPVVVMGERGLGKSHILAVLHHALSSPDAVRTWLESWKDSVEESALKAIKSRSRQMFVHTESLHNQRIRNLWDVFTSDHPEAKFFQGAWGNKTDVPSRDAVIDTLRRCPTALILDEFQTWFDGLVNRRRKVGHDRRAKVGHI